MVSGKLRQSETMAIAALFSESEIDFCDVNLGTVRYLRIYGKGTEVSYRKVVLCFALLGILELLLGSSKRDPFLSNWSRAGTDLRRL
jgi:hypothetical protein